MSSSAERIPVASPVLNGNELAYVTECIKSTWISSQGRFLEAFERAFASFCGVKHAIACNNGTTALHLALVALGVEPGDEVIVPDLTYIASANCVRYCGATPVFVDCDPRTFNIDPDKIRAKITKKTKGIMAVHLFGHPCDMDPIERIAKDHGLFVVEDAAEAHGATYKGRVVGGLSRCASFSFFGNKIITTGEGGAVVTDDDSLAERLRLLRGQGMDPNQRYWFPVVGYNYRMTNVAAAIGLAQMERLHEALEFRKTLASWYNDAFTKNNNIVLPYVEPWAGHSYWMYTILLSHGSSSRRDMIMKELDNVGIETRPVFYPMHVLPPYANQENDFPNAAECSARGISLPTHERLTQSHIERISRELTRILQKY